MPTRRQVYDALKARLAAAWPPRTEPLIWENDGAQIPAAGAWVFAEILFEPERVAAMGAGLGANLWRCTGVLRVEIAIPRGAGGVGDALDMADHAFAAFRGWRAEGVRIAGTDGPQSDDAPEREGRFWRVAAAVRFEADLTG